MKKHFNKKASKLVSVVGASASDFNEAAFENEYFPEGSFEDADAQGLVEVSDGKGTWRKAEPSTRVTLNLSPTIRTCAPTPAAP